MILKLKKMALMAHVSRMATDVAKPWRCVKPMLAKLKLVWSEYT